MKGGNRLRMENATSKEDGRWEGNQKCYHPAEGGLCVEKSNWKSHIGKDRH